MQFIKQWDKLCKIVNFLKFLKTIVIYVSFLKKKIFSNRNETGNRKEYPLY